MRIFRTEVYLADAQIQHEWYARQAGLDIADRYFAALQQVDARLKAQPWIGPSAGFKHPQIRDFRFFLLPRPFHAHLVFYVITDEAVILQRTMHGRRNLTKRLLEEPGEAND